MFPREYLSFRSTAGKVCRKGVKGFRSGSLPVQVFALGGTNPHRVRPGLKTGGQ